MDFNSLAVLYTSIAIAIISAGVVLYLARRPIAYRR